jgi:hypothetical protein
MAKNHTPDLHDRHRDTTGEIRHKRGNTLVATLRKTYGSDFAPGYRSDTKLSILLERTGSKSFGEYLEHSKDGKLPLSKTILSITSKRFETALKNLAKK